MNEPILAVCMPGRMGDIVASEPLFRQLHESNPSLRFVFYTKPAYAELLIKVPYIDQVVTFKDEREYTALESAFPPGSKIVHLNFFHHRDSGSVPKKIPESSEVPEPSLLKQFSDGINFPIKLETPHFYVDESAPFPDLPEKYVVFHCIALGKNRQWTAKKWEHLAQQAFSAGMPVVEIGIGKMLKSDSPLYVDMTGKQNLHTIAKIIRQSRGFVGVESGFGHFANALGVPGVIITGKLRSIPEYNHYSGNYAQPDGNGALVHFFDVETSCLPFDVVSEVFLRMLAGHGFSGAECREFCMRQQILWMRKNLLFRLQELCVKPFRKMFMALNYHRIRHR